MQEQTKKFDIEELILAEIFWAEDRTEQLDILTQLGTKDFENPKWLKLFRVFCSIVAEDKKIDTVNAFQRGRDFITIEELSALSGKVTSAALLDEHVKLLKEFTYKREVFKILSASVNDIKSCYGWDDVDSVKQKVMAALTGITVHDQSKFVNFDQVRDKLFENIEKNEKNIEGFDWGVADLNTYTSGIVTPRLYILGGLKKGGKSRFVINLIAKLAQQGVKNTFLSLEMPEYEIVKLIHAHFTEINDVKLRSKTFMTNEERHRLRTTVIPTQYFSIECAPGVDINGTVNRVKRYASLGAKVVFIDYLQRIKHNPANQANELADICNALADATRANNIAIVLLSQLQNLAERETPSIGHLKGSGAIGESADSIMLFDNLYRRTKKDEDKNKIDIYLEQRYGDSGVIHLASDLGTCHIHDLETQHINEQSGKYRGID